MASLEEIKEKLAEARQEQLEQILSTSGSTAIAKNEYNITTIDEKNVATSLVFKNLSKPKYDEASLIKAIDVEVKELKPDIPKKVKDLVPKPLYDEQVALVADLTKQVATLNAKIGSLNEQIVDLKAQVQNEINNRLNIEQTNDALSNQLSTLSKTVEDFTGQIQSSVQKSVDESVLRASIQAQNVGFKAQIEALIKQIDSLNSIIEGLQAQLGAVQQQQAIQNSTQNIALAAGGDVVNEVAVVVFDPPSQDNTKVVGIFKGDNAADRWDRGEKITISNNDTKPINVKLSTPVWPNGRQFYSVTTTQFTLQPNQKKDITLLLNMDAVRDLDSRPKTGPFGGHTGSPPPYTGGKFNVSVTRTSNNKTDDKTFDTAFIKSHPKSY